MRTKSVIQGFKNSQKIRVIIDGVGIYMTVGETTSRFATTVHYQAVESTLHLMAREGCDGIGHRICHPAVNCANTFIVSIHEIFCDWNEFFSKFQQRQSHKH